VPIERANDKVIGVPQVFGPPKHTQIPHLVPRAHTTHRSKTHAAFSTNMSEPQPEVWEQFIDWSNNPCEGYDWSKGDLLDACSDPMLQALVVNG